ncbi:acyl-ACP--UDP-N-acetylglucosamine O-acyltransferase [Helicobacter sp. 13S00477-4]|uniref:acyl-ACP--UDP-N-acetylglucosamine O-acyltransferase n=1 Tax=Helicobacter sp. 13S00477-4 TaxID=1905759 RepID=UPI000BA70249|nr:acyl-ACP--UDP-N-acetylglucosamine O-acyltransferase [Helicobacter sp. 13S00477-4]PAF52467.1 acyl-[acyl-carrier-protein]--UDP-N-acetylglucosamine O-acyltransferase [Helicobacter sp. 13S00477-4]
MNQKMIAQNAIIKKGAKISQNVEIGDFCIIGENVEIEEGCKLYNNVTILGNTKIGKNTTIFPYAVLGTIPQDLKYEGEEVELIIGENNLIREHCMINPGTKGGINKTIIGNQNLLMAYVHIAHDCIIGNQCILANNATLGGHITIGDYVNIGGMTPVHQFVQIGDGAMIAGASALTQDIPPFCMAEGNRAIIRGLNKHRMRKLFSHEDIDFISQLYKKLFSGNAPIREVAQNEIINDPQNEYVLKICNFILQSQRGIPIRKGSLNE